MLIGSILFIGVSSLWGTFYMVLKYLCMRIGFCDTRNEHFAVSETFIFFMRYFTALDSRFFKFYSIH